MNEFDLNVVRILVEGERDRQRYEDMINTLRNMLDEAEAEQLDGDINLWGNERKLELRGSVAIADVKKIFGFGTKFETAQRLEKHNAAVEAESDE